MMKNLASLTATFCIIICTCFYVHGHTPRTHDNSVFAASFVAGPAVAVWTSHAYIDRTFAQGG